MPPEEKIIELLSDGMWWYGLDLVKAGPPLLQRGTVYVWLSALEKVGYVEHKACSVRPRARMYRLTPKAPRRCKTRNTMPNPSDYGMAV
jgi:DNA-binding PadR family transcriptional regulator